ncbi:MAG: nitrate transporter substrate-binding protein [Homoserinimonas sp.]|jgi:NitT/TauT family transport system substrate-binding protein|nr:nitrate transporter substrate-binding protein [Homoserinimonas sp.]
MKKSMVIGMLAIASLAVTGCAGDTADTPNAGSDTGNENEITPVTVGVIPIVDTAAIWLGEDQGFFDEVGIDLTIETTTGGAAAVPGVVSGDFDFAFGNFISVYVAADQGLDLRFVSNGTTTSDNPDKDFGAVVVPAGSDITSPADLAGKRVSVNNLANIGDTTIRYIVEEDGGDASTIQFVEVAFPDAPAALESGQVDAAWILDPFLTSAVASGAEVISYNFQDFDPELDIAGYFTSGERIDTDENLVSRFQEAMNRSLEYAGENPDEVRRIVGTYTKMTPEVLETITLPRFRTDFDRDAAALLGEAAVKFGTLKEAPDLDKILP